MPRIKRWINAHSDEFHSDGTLKAEVREHMLSTGISDKAINDYAARVKAGYDKLKFLDETDPEPWPIYTAYDFFTTEEKRQFNPDGSLRPEYIQEALEMGISEAWLLEMVRRKQIDIDNYNELSAYYEHRGINFGEQKMNALIGNRRTYAQRIKQMDADLRNCEPEDTLPFDKNTTYWY